MPARELTWPPATPCWVDAQFDDPQAAAQFYAGLFGWDVGGPEGAHAGYRMARIGGRPVAGIGPRDGALGALTLTQPRAWTTYLATDDIGASVTQVRSAGGQVLLEPTQIADSGQMALAADTAGVVFGLWQAGKRIGAAWYNQPATLVWNECLAPDPAAARAFYTEVFGWEYDDLSTYDGLTYHAAKRSDGRVIGGVGALPPDAADIGAHWHTYFGAADTDAAVADVERLGGSVRRTPWQTPYGKMATVAGPAGEVFSFIQINEDGDPV